MCERLCFFHNKFGGFAEDMGNISKWKESLAERTSLSQKINLMQLVYGKPASKSLNDIPECIDEEESEDDEFFKPKGEGNKVCH